MCTLFTNAETPKGADAQSFSVSFVSFASLRPGVVLHANHAPAKPSRHSEERQRRRIFEALLEVTRPRPEACKILHSGSLRLPPFRMAPGINCKEGTSPFVYPFHQRGDAEGAEAQSFSVSFVSFASLRPRVVLHASHNRSLLYQDMKMEFARALRQKPNVNPPSISVSARR